MAKRILLTTIWSSDAIKIAINKISNIDEIIYLVEDNPPKEKLNAISDLKKAFKDIIQINELKTALYDVPKIISDVIKKIDSLSGENEIFIHLSEGRKTLAFGLLFAASLRKDKIKKVYYVIKEKNELLALPLLNLSISDSKKEILKEIMKGNEDKEKIQKNLNLSKSAVYQYLNELKEEGYILNETGLKITALGRVMIL
jgi:CRISPR locus-related DNA-binding protein